MPDLSLNWSDDLIVNASGDILTVDQLLRSQQRIIRRLMTIREEYIWHPEYGASVPKRIGATLDETLIQSVIRAQIFQEASVAQSPPPEITVTPTVAGVFVQIKYFSSEDGQQLQLAFDVSP